MLMDIAAVGDDTIIRGTKETGSILLGSMTIGGK
jgi:PmbA protein